MAAQFQIDILANAGTVEAAASQVEQLEENLSALKKNAQATADVFSAGKAAYAAATSEYKRANSEVERIGEKLEAAQGKLAKAADAGDVSSYYRLRDAVSELTAKQSQATSVAEEAKAKYEAQNAIYQEQKSAANQAKAAVGEHADQLDQAKKSLNDLKDAESAERSEKQQSISMDRALASSLGRLGGPIGMLGQQVFTLKGAWDKLGKFLGDSAPMIVAAAGVAIVAAAIAAAVVAIGVAIVKTAEWAIGLANTSRNVSYLAQGMVQSVAGGAALSGKIDEITNRVPMTRDEVSGLAENLAHAGLRGDALGRALENAAIVASKKKFGPAWENQMLSIEELTKRVHGAVQSIFGGLKIDAFLAALSKIVDLFDDDMASAKAIKSVFESMFQPLIDGATRFLPKVRTAFIQFEILALKTLIAVKPFGSVLVYLALAAGVLAAAIVALVVVGLIPIVAVLAAVTIGVAATIAVIVEIVDLFERAQQAAMDLGTSLRTSVYSAFIDMKAAVTNFFAGFSLEQMGRDLIDGLVRGITAGAAKVTGAIGGVAGDAVKSAKSMLGIASPSRVFAEIGDFTAQGFAQGITNSAAPQAALSSMVNAPSATDQGAPKATSAQQSTSGATISGNTFVLHGVKDADDAEAKISALFTRLLEGDAALGGAEVPA